VFVYDGSGQLVAEYTALTGNDPAPAPAPKVSDLTQDHLGSTRVVRMAGGSNYTLSWTKPTIVQKTN